MEFTKVTFKIIWEMEEDNIDGKMMNIIKGNGKIIEETEKVFGLQVPQTQLFLILIVDNGFKEKYKDTEFIHGVRFD